MKRSKPAPEGGRPRRPVRQRTIGLESLERRELLATLDPTFGVGGRTSTTFGSAGGTNAVYGAVTTQPDGKYIVVGTATGPFGNRDFAIARLNVDGTLDTTFNRGTGVKLVAFDLGGGATGSNDDVATGVVVQPDGRIVVAGTASGSFITLTRLLPDGDFDLSFERDGKLNTNRIRTASDNPILETVSVALQTPQNDPNGRGRIVVAAGNFVIQFDVLDGSQEDFARITFTGNTFDPGAPPSRGASADTIIYDLAIQPDGKIVVVGYGLVTPAPGDTFGAGAAFSGMGAARLNPDGSNDFSFGTLTSFEPFTPDSTPADPTDDPFLEPEFTFSLINRSNVTTSQANGVALTPDGRILLVGTENLASNTRNLEGRLLLARLTSGTAFRRQGRSFTTVQVDGVGDETFTGGEGNFGGGGFSTFDEGVLPIEGIARGLKLDFDEVANRIIAIGVVNQPNPTRQEFAILQTGPNGEIDTNFANSFGADVDRRFQTVAVRDGSTSDLAEDVILLNDGRIVVAGSSANGGTTEIGLVRLLTEEPPSISINDASVMEGDDGQVNLIFTVFLSAAYRLPISVDVVTVNGSAIAPGDYFALPSTTLNFAPGNASITITIPVNPDTIDEPDESFFVNLSSPVLGTLGKVQGTGFILDNDPTPPPPLLPPDPPVVVPPPPPPPIVTPPGPGDPGTIVTVSVTGVQRVFVRRGGRRVFVGVRLLFNGNVDAGVASQTGLYRVNQRRRAVNVNQALVSGNVVTLILARPRPGPLRVAFGGLTSANGLPIAGGSLGV